MSTNDSKWVAGIRRKQRIFEIIVQKDLKAGDKLAFSRSALARLIRFEQDLVGIWKDVS